MTGDLRIVPANEASWHDVRAVFGESDYPHKCQCQWYRSGGPDWNPLPHAEREAALRAQTRCGNPAATETSGLIAYLDDVPVGWVAVEPRANLPLLPKPTVYRGRDEDPADGTVWAVSCFVVRKGYRGRGLTYPLAEATVQFARDRGARALEGYAMITIPGKEITWGELHVGPIGAFEEAGFIAVRQPSKRRVVMRIDF